MAMVCIWPDMHEDSGETVDGRLLAGVQVLRHVKFLRKLDVRIQFLLPAQSLVILESVEKLV